MSAALLEVNDLSIYFPANGGYEQVVNNLSFSVCEGETLALVGESGSGKSMTALAICQLLPLNARVGHAAEILLRGQNILSLSQREMRAVRGRDVAIVFQDAQSSFNPVLTIGVQIGEVLDVHFNLSRSAKEQRIRRLLDEVGIRDVPRCYRSYPHQLSGGMRQRAMIAMALAAEPKILIADEATTALDVTLQAQVLALLKTIQKRYNMGVVFITHDLTIVQDVADKMMVMQRGAAVEHVGTPQFFIQPHHPYSQLLLAATPGLDIVQHREVRSKAPILETKNLTVHFGSRRKKNNVCAAKDINIKLYPGRTLALVGESGSGKSTVAKAIMRLIDVYEGRVFLEGERVDHRNGAVLRRVRKKLQIVFQDPFSALNPRMLVADILEEGLRAQKIYRSRADRQKRVDELLELVQLDPKLKYRYPHEFSGGQRQRVCIARALSVDPTVLICDEPTSALDVSTQKQVLALLSRLQSELGLAYLLITHNFAVVAQMADEVAVMSEGEVVEYGSVEQVLKAPQHPYTQALLAAVPTLKKSEALLNANE